MSDVTESVDANVPVGTAYGRWTQSDATDRYYGGQPAPEGGTAQGRDIVQVLLGQHEEIKRRFAQLQAADGEERGRLFGELADLLHARETGEQQVAHPVIRGDATGGRQIAADRLEEEQKADRALAELKALGVGHPNFRAKLEAFHRAVLAHAAAEEEQEFPRLGLLPPRRRQELAEELRTVQNAPNPE